MKLSDFKIWPTAVTDSPNQLRMWQADVYGVGAVVAAVSELLAGDAKTIHFVAAKHPVEGGDALRTYSFGIGLDTYRNRSVRFLGERNDPDGAGSSRLTDCPTRETVTGAIVFLLARASEHFWRVQP